MINREFILIQTKSEKSIGKGEDEFEQI